MEEVRILIATPSGRDSASDFTYSLAALHMYLGQRPVFNIGGRTVPMTHWHLNLAKQAYLVTAREDHIMLGIQGTPECPRGFTHILSFDDDMAFPHDTLHRLIAHDLPVVTANYRKKTEQAYIGVCQDTNGQWVDSVGKTGLQRVVGMGMGVTLIRVADIKHIPQPFFEVRWSDTEKRHVIEDGYFSMKLRDHGVNIYCDHDLTQDIGHVGRVKYVYPGRPPVGPAPLLTAEQLAGLGPDNFAKVA